MKIAYISISALTDSDLPLLHELKAGAEVDYYLIVTNTTRQGTVINLKLKEKGGIFSGTEYPELKVLEDWIDLSHVFIVNKPVNHDWEWTNFRVSWQWMKMLMNYQYDIIHLTWPLRYCSFPLYALHKKMVVTMHDPLPHSSNMTFENKLHRWFCLQLTPDFILLNHTQKPQFMKAYGISEERVHMSMLSIFSHLQNTKAAPPMNEKPYILYVGSIMPHKGIEYLCEAMKTVVTKKPDLHVVIAGKGQFYFDVKPYLEHPNFTFINRFITNEELASLIIHSIAVVCPYIDATQSGVVMSAFALNKPVIATKVGALSEMVSDKRFGILVPARDSSALAQAIHYITKPGVAEEMIQNIVKEYSEGTRSWKQIAAMMLSTYESIIQRRNK